MYVCLCRGVTDRQIREAAGEGACRMRDLCARLGIAVQCGKCAKCARQILKETLASGGKAAGPEAP
jgi:bacterioferritin-associated ferredoxin